MDFLNDRKKARFLFWRALHVRIEMAEIKSNFIKETLQKFETAPSGLNIAGLRQKANAYWLSWLRKYRQGCWLILTESEKQAEELISDFLFFGEELTSDIHYYPAWEPHPYDTFSPHPQNVIARLEVLYELVQKQGHIIVTTIEAIMQRVIPQEILIESCVVIRKDQEIEREAFLSKLYENGYHGVSSVEDRGTYAVRGGIIDIFPPLYENPLRIEFFGDMVESIRYFDPETQRSFSETNISEITIIPVREIIFSQKSVLYAEDEIKRQADDQGVKKEERERIIECVRQRTYFSGIDYYLPFFYESLHSFFDYLPVQFDLFYFEKSKIHALGNLFQKEYTRDQEDAIKQGRISANIEKFYLTTSQTLSYLNQRKYWNFTELLLLEEKDSHVKVKVVTHEDIRYDLRRLKKTSLEILDPLVQKIKAWRDEGYRVYFIAHTKIQQMRFCELMMPYGLKCFISETRWDNHGFETAPFSVYDVVCVTGILGQGFSFELHRIVFITETEIFGERRKLLTKKSDTKAPFVTSLSELTIGDPVVHSEHGVAQYLGLKRLTLGGGENDYVLLQYADQDKLYLPVHRLEVIQRYVGTEQNKVQLDKLGGMAWQKSKAKVKKAIQEIAHELLEIYAIRSSRSGHAFGAPDAYFREFEATFPYEETPDQLKAIEDILSDLCSDKPMDRLVCGDVGYGKTEVAIRAAFKVVLDRKQVAILAPTTLLVDQHYRVIKKRCENFPVTVEMLSRFVSSKEQKKIIERLKKGEVDIVVGTHRLLSVDIDYKDLGLLIIDEEQRFGVVHKEKIKKLKKMLDVLTLSATPIPRTLHMALLGIRDLSVINTPPLDRRAIRTYVTKFDEATIREAITNEIHRGGQVFFVHNRVETIAEMARKIEKCVPDIKIRFAHGQLSERLLEKIMIDFLHQKFQVLVCTTIIGSGIDISTVNTIIIDRADTFGLSTLYQLRGRVGRSHERAFAYLLIPDDTKLSEDAKKRLEIIQNATELGAGFHIASHDLEIRGGGNILGRDQSGHIEAIGFELYTELLEQTVRELKGEITEETIDPDIRLKVNAYIPEAYIPDMSDKLAFYRHLATLSSEDALQDIESEMKDRFGPLPPIVYDLFEIMVIKFYLKKLKIKSIDFGNERVVLTISDRTPIPVEGILKLVKREPKRYRLISGEKISIHIQQWKEILPVIRNFYEQWGEVQKRSVP